MIDMLHQFVGADADPEIVDWLGKRIFYVQGDFSDPANFTRLVRHYRDNLAYQMAPIAIGLLKNREQH